MNQPLKVATTLVALVFVLLIFIAPMIDMPETVLREHQVSAHTPTSQMVSAFHEVSSSIHLQGLPVTDPATLPATAISVGISTPNTALVLRC